MFETPGRGVVAIFAALTCNGLGASPIANPAGRARTSLAGEWHVIVDPYDTGFYDYRRQPYDRGDPIKGGFALDHEPDSPSELVEYSFDRSPALKVPGDWNTQDPKLFYYEGSVWYRRHFDDPRADGGKRLLLYFEGANYETDVYLNGHKLGAHTGGFTPFQFEITKLVQPKANSLVVRVNDRRRPDGVPTESTDWWNYGGITRDVWLIEAPETFVADYGFRLIDGAPQRVAGWVQLDGARKKQAVRVRIAAGGVDLPLQTNENGRAGFEVPAPELGRWSPESPLRQDVEIAAETDVVREQIGFRTVKTEGADILLNGRKIFLRGVCLHEENPLRGGRAWSEADARRLLGWAKDLGCNFMRLAHYPHNEHMARVADELGLLVWEEVPVYWTIQWENPQTLANARAQLAEVIARDRNRASVIVWSVANETPVSDARTNFLCTLIDDARRLDGTRLVSAAMEMHGDRANPDNPDLRIVDDPLGAHTDLVAFNEYVGWYDGTPEKCDRVQWKIGYNKPVVISEFGAGAKAGFHAGAGTRFSEEWQAEVYRRTPAMLERIPGFSGMTPWILVDFRSPRRLLPELQDGWNRKGLIDDQGRRKAAFDVLRSYYEKRR